MSQPNPSLTPDPILQTAFGFWSSKVLLTAVEFGLFTKLASRKLTGAQLGHKLQLHPRAISDFFDALVAMKFLERDGDGPEAKYGNTPAGALYLDEKSPRYIGGILVMLNARLFKYWHDLPEALRTGQPQNEVKHGEQGIFEALYAEPAKLEQFLGAMTGLSRINFEALAEKFDFSKYKTLCDVGGATGLLCIEAARKHPQLRCVSFDLPEVAPIAQRHIAAAGLSDRIATAAGNFFTDPLPPADVITMGMILHDWNLEKKMHLIRAAYDALPPGGALIAVEALIDDARRENVFGLLMSLNMLIEFGEAFDYSGADFKKWCTEAGFQRFEVIHLAGPSSAAIAYK
ncbi:MAG: methyltransferase [Chthoniobacterales bacterium]|nr:methyltransferase [Chthoniobacterales bacterium]